MDARISSWYDEIDELSEYLTDLLIFLTDLFSGIVEDLPNHLVNLTIYMHFVINVRIRAWNCKIHQIPERLIHLLALGSYLIAVNLSICHDFIEFPGHFIRILNLFMGNHPVNKGFNL